MKDTVKKALRISTTYSIIVLGAYLFMINMPIPDLAKFLVVAVAVRSLYDRVSVLVNKIDALQ